MVISISGLANSDLPQIHPTEASKVKDSVWRWHQDMVLQSLLTRMVRFRFERNRNREPSCLSRLC